jgi:hypothetical protein
MSTLTMNSFSQIRDDFNSKQTLADWQNLTVDGWIDKWKRLEIDEKQGNLVIEPKSAGWFEDNFGQLLYKDVAGDFIVTTRLKVEGTANDKKIKTMFSLAGLFIRSPRTFTQDTWRPGQENWLFFSTGSATEPGNPQFEIKSTYQSTSTLKIYPAKQGWIELRIVRLGEIFTLLYRDDKEEWKYLDQFIRPDLPYNLQVGLTAYADWASSAEIYPDYLKNNKTGSPKENADLVAYFDYFIIRKPEVKKVLPIALPISEEFWKDFTRD